MVKLSAISQYLIYLSAFKVKKIVSFDDFLPLLVVLLTVSPSLSADISSTDSCLLEQIKEAKSDKTIGAIRTECSARFSKKKRNTFLLDSADNTEPDGGPIARRIELEEGVELNPFVLTAHKPNYFLPFAHNFDPNDEPFLSELGGKNMDKTEMKFQVSLKFPVWKGLYKGNGDIYVAYTNLSFWQAYNGDFSRPFRETNHEPEIFLSFKNNWKFWGVTNNLINVGIVHQSNGQSGDLSRSWNRIYAHFVFQKDNFSVSLKPWLRILKDDKDDDNPDIEKYLGHGELRIGYKWGNHTFSSMFRHNFRSDQKGALELGWSFPLVNRSEVMCSIFMVMVKA